MRTRLTRCWRIQRQCSRLLSARNGRSSTPGWRLELAGSRKTEAVAPCVLFFFRRSFFAHLPGEPNAYATKGDSHSGESHGCASHHGTTISTWTCADLVPGPQVRGVLAVSLDHVRVTRRLCSVSNRAKTSVSRRNVPLQVNPLQSQANFANPATPVRPSQPSIQTAAQQRFRMPQACPSTICAPAHRAASVSGPTLLGTAETPPRLLLGPPFCPSLDSPTSTSSGPLSATTSCRHRQAALPRGP